MPLILNRRPGQRTFITFPCGSVATIECTGNGHKVVQHNTTLEFGKTANGVYIRPAGEDWPVCIIALYGSVDGSWWHSYSFDAPPEVKIHLDDIKDKK